MMMVSIKTIPELDCSSTTLKEFCNAYASTSCVLLVQTATTHTKKKRKRKVNTNQHLEYLLQVFQSASPKDQESWCVETTTKNETNNCIKPIDFLYPSNEHQDGYCSFILQDDTNQAISTFNCINTPIFPILKQHDDTASSNKSIQTSRPIWIFVGRNSSKTQALEGRSEHTDNIQHDGTVHYQVSGTKSWYIRPTQELRDQCKIKKVILEDSYKVTLSEGDRIVINTRLWWHRTEIPPPQDDSDDNVSISYAQDVYLNGRGVPAEEEEEVMSNVEGAWAVGFIPKGTQLLTETTSVDELPMQRTNDIDKANCKLVIVSEEGEEPTQRAVVTLRDIQESEFFILLDDDKQV